MTMELNRRTILRGMVNGTAVAVGLPLLDMFLDVNGEALAATGAPVPIRFGTWFWGLGVNPPRFFPDKAGPLGALKIEAEPMTPFKSKINILGNFNVLLDGAPNRPHGSGGPSIRQGRAPAADDRGGGASFDVTVADAIGTSSRFRSLDVSPSGGARNSLSSSGNGIVNPSESTPQGLYMRIFGEGFRDPNSATFVPDPEVVARRSVLSGVMEPIKAMESQLGASDKQRLDQYFTSLRQLENQLDVQLTKPSPMEGCVVPKKVSELKVSNEIETVVVNHQIMADLLVMALACDNTRVFNMNFNQGSSNLTRAGSTITHHQLTHEETLDQKLGYQPNATYFVNKIMEGWAYFVKALDSVKEGDRTLLDNTLVFAHSETEFAKFHTIDNIPMMTAGSAGGRVKTGLYVDGGGTPVSRVGLTLQQAMGVSVDRWGAKSMETNKSIGEMLV
jgi:hypothetical protein